MDEEFRDQEDNFGIQTQETETQVPSEQQPEQEMFEESRAETPVETPEEPEEQRKTQTERMEEAFQNEREQRYSRDEYGSSFYTSGDTAEGNGSAGISIASMVCGILSILCCCTGWFGLILSAIALVMGIVSVKNNYSGREMAIAGIITGGCGIALCFVMLIFAAIVNGLSNSVIRDTLQIYDLYDLQDIL
ncbi:MAG: DUF4190 domain-containing protein [Lachnospiraceae bacterium]|nr:DUF4190 domain-containing protein [Lachnospiraceae bacterium]